MGRSLPGCFPTSPQRPGGTATERVHVSGRNQAVQKNEGVTDLPCRCDVNLDVVSLWVFVVIVLSLLDERGVGQCQEFVLDALRSAIDGDDEVDILAVV